MAKVIFNLSIKTVDRHKVFGSTNAVAASNGILSSVWFISEASNPLNSLESHSAFPANLSQHRLLSLLPFFSGGDGKRMRGKERERRRKK